MNYFHDDYDIYIGIINNDESANVQLIGQSADEFTHYVNFDTSAQDGIVNIYSVFTALADNIKEDETPAVFFFADLYTTNTLCFFCSSWTEADIEAYNEIIKERMSIPCAHLNFSKQEAPRYCEYRGASCL